MCNLNSYVSSVKLEKVVFESELHEDNKSQLIKCIILIAVSNMSAEFLIN